MLVNALSFTLAVAFANQYNISNPAGFLYAAGPYNISSQLGTFTMTDVNLTNLDLTNRLDVSVTSDDLLFAIGEQPINVTGNSTVEMSGFVLAMPFTTPIVGRVNLTLAPNNSIIPGANCSLNLTIASSDLDVCSEMMSSSESTPQNIQAATPHPQQGYATRVGDSHMLRAISNVAKALDGRIPFQLRVTAHTDTIVRAELTMIEQVERRMHLPFASIREHFNKMLYGVLQVASPQMRTMIDNITATIASLNITNAPIDGVADLAFSIPNSTTVLVDVAVTDFQCDDSGFTCSFPAARGVQLSSIVLSGPEKMGMPAAILHGLIPMVNTMLTTALSSTCDSVSGRCTVAAPHPRIDIVPQLGLLIGLPIACVVITAALVALSVLRYKRKPVLRLSGEPVPLYRIIIEDTLFGFVVTGTAALFIFSNVTTAASVVVGGEFEMYVFSLKTSIQGMWNSGLRPLSVLVLLFSGIYPYIKLLCMLVFTVGIQRPNSVVLRSIDIIGKYSFLDSFIMLIMVAGMSVDGIGDVKMLPSFFLFVAATVLSILAGNYATHLWRHGTNVRAASATSDAMPEVSRKLSNTTERDDYDNTLEPISTDDTIKLRTSTTVSDDCSQADSKPESCLLRLKRRVWWRVALPSCALIIATTVPLFASTCLSFDFGGVAGLLLSGDRRFNAYSIAMKAHWVCAVICIYTILVAPVVSALFYTPLVFLVSWTTADVFILSCISGLVQINRFVQFTLGGNYDSLYNVHVHLHWPLYTLVVAAVTTWVLYVAHVYNLRSYASRYFGRQHSSIERE